MSPKTKNILKRLEDWLGAEDDPKDPIYDPVHLAGAVVVGLVVVGCLYWLLWTLLVYEGGFFAKASAMGLVVFTSKTMADFGYQGSPYAMGLFEGWVGNTGALILCMTVIAVLFKVYKDAERKSARAKR